MSTSITGSPVTWLLLKIYGREQRDLILKTWYFIDKSTKNKKIQTGRVEYYSSVIVNVSFNLLGVPQRVVLHVKAVQITVRQVYKTTE